MGEVEIEKEMDEEDKKQRLHEKTYAEKMNGHKNIEPQIEKKRKK